MPGLEARMADGRAAHMAARRRPGDVGVRVPSLLDDGGPARPCRTPSPAEIWAFAKTPECAGSRALQMPGAIGWAAAAMAPFTDRSPAAGDPRFRRRPHCALPRHGIGSR